MKKLQSNKGFTLVELIIVIAILAIIMLIAIPNFSGIQQRMQVRADKATAAQIGKAVRIWYTEYNSDPSFKSLVDTTSGDSGSENAIKDAHGDTMPSDLADSTKFVAGGLPNNGNMAHLCQIPQLITYVDTTLVPSSLVDSSTNVKASKQYYYVGITGSGTGEKIVVAISNEKEPSLNGSTTLTQADVLYNGETTDSDSPVIAEQVAYIEP